MSKTGPNLTFLRPAAGRRVSHRDGRLFAAGGESEVFGPFYQRLLAAGDLETIPARAAHRAAPKSKTVPKLPEGKAP